jgi:hypothetical protein
VPCDRPRRHHEPSISTYGGARSWIPIISEDAHAALWADGNNLDGGKLARRR